MTHYSTYYVSQLVTQNHHHRSHQLMQRGAEAIIGALLLLSPMFWIFIAELIK